MFFERAPISAPELEGRAAWPRPVAYGLAVVLALLAISSEVALGRLVVYAPQVMFYLAVLVAARYGGRGPGLCCLAVSVIGRGTELAFSLGPLTAVIASISLAIVGTVIVVFVTSSQRMAALLRREDVRREFLLRAIARLEHSRDVERTLDEVVAVAVPSIADLCAVDVLDGGRRRRVALASADPRKRELAEELERRYPPTKGPATVIADGEPRLVTRVDAARADAEAVDDAHRDLLHRLAIRSYVSVPIRRGDQVLGAISLAMAESGRLYDERDLGFAVAFADRVGIAIENARLLEAASAARERAEAANRAKDDFLAMLGHELRNPLAPISIALDLLEHQAPAIATRERAVIARQVQHLARLVDDLLDVSRIVRGKVELHRRPIELADVVADAIDTTSPMLEQRGHQLVVDVPRGLILDGDHDRLTQIVANLVGNAAKYTEPGGRITITGAADDVTCTLVVRDNGVGISADMVSKVFDLFTQERQASDRARGGLGLGLAIVKNLVELHGGSVRAASAGPGRGSEFTVELPRLHVEAVVAAPPPRAARREGSPGPILVVDDNPDALAMLAAGLEQRGFQIYSAGDGPSALAVADRVRPALALLDLGLPVMDGYELARRLRERDDRVQLVAISGYGQPSDLERSRAAGFAEHLVKPVTLEVIAEAIGRLGAPRAA